MNFQQGFWNSETHRISLVNGRPKCFFGRRLRSQLPHLPGANDLDIANAKKGAEQRKSHMMDSKNKPGIALPELTIGQKVLTQNPLSNAWENKGVISNIRPTKRSYDVEYDSGETFVRNRKYLRPILKQTTVPATPTNPNSTNYDEEFPPLQIPALRRSTRIANKKKVTFGNTSIIQYFE